MGIVFFILLLAMGVNITVNLKPQELADSFPFLGVAVWIVILLSIPLCRPDWEEVGAASKEPSSSSAWTSPPH